LQTGETECYAIWRFHRHEQESHVFFEGKRQRWKKATTVRQQQQQQNCSAETEEEKTKRGTKEKGKGTAVKK
jgi:hypothetical protein